MFSLGFVSAILGDHTLEEVFVFASTHGFSCVEIMCWPASNKDARRYAGVCHIDVDQLDMHTIEHIIQLQLKYKVGISALGYYPNPLDDDAEQSKYYIDHIKKVIKACKSLNIPVMNTFVGRDPARDVDFNISRFKEVWPSIIALAEELHIKIGIENCPMLFTRDEWPGGKNLATTPAIWDRLFDILPSKYFGLNYDPSHLIWQRMDEVAPIYHYADRLHHIHLKDAKVYPEKLNKVGIMAYPLEYHSPKLPGLGDVRWRDFFSALTSVRYRGPVCIEVEDKAYEGSREDIYASILTARNFVSQFLSS
ncbi:MAG: sugar phosphate isomerase/epimerase [Saprospiraceae bacterium]|jgi:sugar phosphate isomerase/epimerase|nr:sugar phosphate isomerase/epimerase [Saprospiraceae bacterium]MBK7439872.1 sugar phosphate isomerase/epimerase [Saprospiraceae bacterium]MBK7608930.1 sugar phosphate isomerase/epimerase [Saprospiraceae bacterium]MBK8513190.1 sugar phosphate isomerase/epimerase [Saprospiraceae bacterium]MBK8779244.1 sugar phosphate isomerase/epimerase [Saprospiraceae bacterium]